MVLDLDKVGIVDNNDFVRPCSKTLKRKNTIMPNDEIVLNKSKQELENYDYYEIESIESLGKITTVIANTGYLEIAIDIDNKTGQTLNKEKIARQ